MKKLLFKGGELCMTEGVFEADMLVENRKIVEFYKDGEYKGDAEIVDCRGKKILPGAIDVHVHFREPGAAYKEDWVSASTVAAVGGVTTVLDMPNNEPPLMDLKTLAAKRALVSGRSFVNYGFYMGFNGSNLDEIIKAQGIAGVKIYMADSTGNLGVENGFDELFAKYKGNIVVHAEDAACIRENSAAYLSEFGNRNLDPSLHSKIRSVECAVKAVKAVCELAKKHKRNVHIAHVTSSEELEIISKYENVTCEVCPHHLIFCTDDYESKGNFIKVNPPIRERVDLFGLWKGIKFGEVDLIASDHAPHTIVEKELDYLKAPSGVPGVGYLLPIMLNAVNDEGLEMTELVRLCCENPALIFGIKNKGKLEDGYDADIVVVDMDLEKKIERENVRDKCGWSPYEGLTLKGWPIMTFVGGEKVDVKKMGKEVDF